MTKQEPVLGMQPVELRGDQGLDRVGELVDPPRTASDGAQPPQEQRVPSGAFGQDPKLVGPKG